MNQIKESLKTLYRLWMKFAHALGRVNTLIFLTLFYFIFLGIAKAVCVIAGKDPMDSKWKDRKSYWRQRTHFKVDRETCLKPY